LHFASEWVQGAMRLSKPDALELDYCKHMMAWLLFLAPPERQLQMGLGAAALSKFVLRHMPQSELTAVEISSSVIHAAHVAFRLPREHQQLVLVNDDANNYIARPAIKNRFGVIQIDLYDQHARGPVCESVEFYQHVFNAMDPKGSVLAVNLFGEHASFERNLKRLKQVFEGRVLALPPVEAGNIIALAFKGPSFDQPVENLYERAAIVEQQYGLKARGWVNALKAGDGVGLSV
jgi:spermidine synthase